MQRAFGGWLPSRAAALPQFGEQRLEGRRLSSRDQAVHTCSRDARPREGEKGIGHAPAHSQRARRTRSSAHATAVRDPRARKATFDSGVNAGCTASSQSRCRVYLVLHLPRVVSNVHRAQRLGRLHDIAHVMCTTFTLHRESGTRKRHTKAAGRQQWRKRCHFSRGQQVFSEAVLKCEWILWAVRGMRCAAWMPAVVEHTRFEVYRQSVSSDHTSRFSGDRPDHPSQRRSGNS